MQELHESKKKLGFATDFAETVLKYIKETDGFVEQMSSAEKSIQLGAITKAYNILAEVSSGEKGGAGFLAVLGKSCETVSKIIGEIPKSRVFQDEFKNKAKKVIEDLEVTRSKCDKAYTLNPNIEDGDDNWDEHGREEVSSAVQGILKTRRKYIEDLGALYNKYKTPEMNGVLQELGMENEKACNEIRGKLIELADQLQEMGISIGKMVDEMLSSAANFGTGLGSVSSVGKEGILTAPMEI